MDAKLQAIVSFFFICSLSLCLIRCADEAMFRMDAKLASYFATLKEGKGGAARAARDELVNFKMRVAGLVEAFCKRVSRVVVDNV